MSTGSFPTNTQKFLDALVNLDGGSGSLTRQLHFPGREAETASWPAWALPEIAQAFTETGVKQPWKHQIEAAEAAHAGKHTVIATGTGSGKSLAAWLPVLNTLQAHGSHSERLSLKNWAKPPHSPLPCTYKSTGSGPSTSAYRPRKKSERSPRRNSRRRHTQRNERMGACPG